MTSDAAVGEAGYFHRQALSLSFLLSAYKRIRIPSVWVRRTEMSFQPAGDDGMQKGRDEESGRYDRVVHWFNHAEGHPASRPIIILLVRLIIARYLSDDYQTFCLSCV